MKKGWLLALGFLWIGPVLAQDRSWRIDFSEDTAEENQVTVMGAGFGQYPPASVTYAAIPTDNVFSDATDGRGAVIHAAPGEGVMILGTAIVTPNAMVLRCSVRSDSSNVQITMAALDQGKNEFVVTSSPNNGAWMNGQYKRLSLYFVPPSTGLIPLIQIVNPSSTDSVTVYLDNFDGYVLDPARYYHGQFLDGDEDDPASISLPVEDAVSSSPSFQISPQSAVMDIGAQTQFYGTASNGATRFFWRSDSSAISLSGNGFVSGLQAGNAWITAHAGTLSSEALLFVNPLVAHHVDQTYEWYQTQMGTGAAQYNNCGPTSTHMAIRWYKNLSVPVDQIRETNPRDNGWWYTSDIFNALDLYQIPYSIYSVKNEEDIRACLERGNIVMLCVTMKEIAYDREAYFGRFYTFDSGHFLIVKGWSEDGQYFVVYDPNSWNDDYDSTGVMLGRNRFYKASEVLQAVKIWWPYCIEIGDHSGIGVMSLAQVPEGHAGPETPDGRGVVPR